MLLHVVLRWWTNPITTPCSSTLVLVLRNEKKNIISAIVLLHLKGVHCCKCMKRNREWEPRVSCISLNTLLERRAFGLFAETITIYRHYELYIQEMDVRTSQMFKLMDAFLHTYSINSRPSTPSTAGWWRCLCSSPRSYHISLTSLRAASFVEQCVLSDDSYWVKALSVDDNPPCGTRSHVQLRNMSRNPPGYIVSITIIELWKRISSSAAVIVPDTFRLPLFAL